MLPPYQMLFYLPDTTLHKKGECVIKTSDFGYF